MPNRIALVLSAAIFALATAQPSRADEDAGSYLAAQSALSGHDFADATKYLARSLSKDPHNLTLMEGATSAYLSMGDLDKAAAMARRIVQNGSKSQVAALTLLGDGAKRGAWDGVLADLDAGQSVGPLFDGLLRAWAEVGAGRMSDALAAFDKVAGNSGLEPFGLYHKALALGSVGDFEGAAKIFADEGGKKFNLTRRATMAYAEILSQLERDSDAADLITSNYGANTDPVLTDMVDRLSKGETLPFTAVRNAEDGVAEIYFSIASALQNDAQPDYTLLYARMAIALRPDHIDALLLSAQLLEDLDRFDLATDVYDGVPRDNPSYTAAELGRADALRRSGRDDAAIEVLKQLAESHGDVPLVQVTFGDTLRGLERYQEAIAPYSKAIELIGTPEERHWVIFFARGISYERTQQFDKADADFQEALKLKPEQPQVLNYLGYSYLQRNMKLADALKMIERAVALRPDSGYIVDSLGWALYRLGRYDEAVKNMEHAVELMPVDPVVNDHLGDVYWAAGRHREAEFQWHRALSFITDTSDSEADPARIRRKLEVGLDKVLQEEGAPPLKVANDDG